MIDVKQNKSFKNQLLRIPLLEREVEESVLQIKKNYGQLALIGCIFSTLGVSYAFRHQSNQADIKNNAEKQYNLNLEFQLRTQLYCFSMFVSGILVDLSSLNFVFIFSIAASIFGMTVNIIYFFYQNEQVMIFGSIIAELGLYNSLLCSNYIIYDSQFNLRKRFNYAAIYHLISIYLPILLPKIENAFGFQSNQKFGFVLDIVGIFFSAIGAICVYFSFYRIEKERCNSKAYKRFLLSQGIGVSLRQVVKYYNNSNMKFLFFIIFATSFSTSMFNPKEIIQILQDKQKNQLLENTMQICYNVSLIVGGGLITFYVNSSDWIIQNAMRMSKYLININLVSQLLLCLFVYFQNYFSYNFAYGFYLFVMIIQGCIHFPSKRIIFEVLSCFQNSQSSIKCIGFSLILFIQEEPKILFSSQIPPIIIFSLQLLVILISKIYAEHYLKNKSFIQLESNIKNQLIAEKNNNNIETKS